MSIITFWNNSKRGNIGQTASLIATATSMAVEHNYKILILSTQPGDKELDKAYGVREDFNSKFLGLKESRFDSGIEGIMKLSLSGKLTPEQFGDYTKIVLKGNRLDVISGKKVVHAETENFNFSKYPEIIKIANKFYDMVFVDLDRGLNSELTKKILSVSNLVVWNLEQKLEAVNKIEELQNKEKIIDEKKTIYLLNRYEKNSKYNVKNMIRNSNMKKKIYTVPYDPMFGDNLQDGVIDQWFLNPKIRRATIYEEHGFFIAEINKLCEGIINRLQELHVLG